VHTPKQNGLGEQKNMTIFFDPLPLLPLSFSQHDLNLSFFSLQSFALLLVTQSPPSPSNITTYAFKPLLFHYSSPASSRKLQNKIDMNHKKMHIFTFCFSPSKKLISHKNINIKIIHDIVLVSRSNTMSKFLCDVSK
jgi:hypothetical protein